MLVLPLDWAVIAKPLLRKPPLTPQLPFSTLPVSDRPGIQLLLVGRVTTERKIMEDVTAFNYDILESPFFKLTLGDEERVVGNDTVTAFYVQRELLASLSPELRKHINNDMKEGLNGEMVLHDVDKDTLQRFLEWAYVKDYRTDSGSHATSSALLLHAKLYVFADRFNIGSLKDLSFQKLTSILNEQSDPDPSLSADVLKAAGYAIANLPALTERLAEYFLGYIAWKLDNVRDLADFTEIFRAQPDAAVALLRLARRAEKPPPKMSSAANKSIPSSSFSATCATCKQNGNVTWVCCKTCKTMWGAADWDYTDLCELRCKYSRCRKIGDTAYLCGKQDSNPNCKYPPASYQLRT
ncbi:hypothetical protein BDZ91DRAFT_742852 [Kalaharituber pfeilii]|nr:hypothetical protein BDZ91DRAFT_742852 [Kalaharituber pfeilii]